MLTASHPHAFAALFRLIALCIMAFMSSNELNKQKASPSLRELHTYLAGHRSLGIPVSEGFFDRYNDLTFIRQAFPSLYADLDRAVRALDEADEEPGSMGYLADGLASSRAQTQALQDGYSYHLFQRDFGTARGQVDDMLAFIQAKFAAYNAGQDQSAVPRPVSMDTELAKAAADYAETLNHETGHALIRLHMHHALLKIGPFPVQFEVRGRDGLSEGQSGVLHRLSPQETAALDKSPRKRRLYLEVMTRIAGIAAARYCVPGSSDETIYVPGGSDVDVKKALQTLSDLGVKDDYMVRTLSRMTWALEILFAVLESTGHFWRDLLIQPSTYPGITDEYEEREGRVYHRFRINALPIPIEINHAFLWQFFGLPGSY
jgi:hypothetical protein